MEGKLDLAQVRSALASAASAGFRSNAPLAREGEAKVGKIGANVVFERLSQAMVGKGGRGQ